MSGAQVADGVEHRLDPSSVTVARIAGGIATAVLALLSLVFFVVMFFVGSRGLVLGLSLAGAWFLFVGFLTFMTLWWPGVKYRHTFYSVSEEGIVIRRGVLWRATHNIPRSRVQHTDVSQGPVERAFELATLVIYTAGTHHASTSLDGLPRDRAFRIRDHLIAVGDDDAV